MVEFSTNPSTHKHLNKLQTHHLNHQNKEELLRNNFSKGDFVFFFLFLLFLFFSFSFLFTLRFLPFLFWFLFVKCQPRMMGEEIKMAKINILSLYLLNDQNTINLPLNFHFTKSKVFFLTLSLFFSGLAGKFQHTPHFIISQFHQNRLN